MTPAAIICTQAGEAARSLDDDSATLLLTGSLARDEATFVLRNGVLTGLGDADFFLVSKRDDSAPADRIKKDLEDRLRRQRIACPITVNAVTRRYLQSLPPHILTYETRHSGRVVYGDPSIFSLIPAYRVQDLSLLDAFCLLSNRMVEFLEIAGELAVSPIHYRTVKLYLDMATAFLLAQGVFQPTYRARAAELWSRAPEWKVAGFAARVEACTAIKLGGFQSIPEDAPSWQQAVFDAHRVWRLLLVRLTEAGPAFSDSELVHRLMRQQPLLLTLRGWLSVLRHAGLRRVRGWQNNEGLLASPRYLLYQAASERFFGLPWTRDWAPDSIRQLASDYHQVLEKTRA
jgi:hypothetical protein